MPAWSVLLILACLAAAPLLAAAETLPGTQPLETKADLAAEMVAGIDRYLDRQTAAAVANRSKLWKPDYSSHAAYMQSQEPVREELRRILGLGPRPASSWAPLEVVSMLGRAEVARGNRYKVYQVRWPALPGVDGEGLLLEPEEAPAASIVALPDCDWTPEQLCGLAPGVPAESQFARRLAESGCRVLVPFLIDRGDTYSGREGIRFTNQPHREFIYRGAFELGHTLIGYEVQKVLTGIDALSTESRGQGQKIGVIGYGEGGLLALYSAAVDPRITAVGVSGYFAPREALWHEPIYRNLFGFLNHFGDAELAAMVAPRAVFIEACRSPEVSGPPAPHDGRSGAAPGVLSTPSLAQVTGEVERARALIAPLQPRPSLRLVGDGKGQPGSADLLEPFLKALGGGLSGPGEPPQDSRASFNTEARRKRQFHQLVDYNERLLHDAQDTRDRLWSGADAASVESWARTTARYRDQLWRDVIGQFPPADAPMNPRTRLIYDEPKYRGYEVVLDVWPEVYAYGILLVPKDIKPGERRPVVVCQHGLEGRPTDVANPQLDSPYYHRFACKLAEEGFVTFAPQNPYIGQDRFRMLQRKANPIGESLFSVIVRQHERILQWLGTQPFVDPQRMAFYGLSYGGKTAMRVPALLTNYCLSICSGDFNEWIWKNVTTHSRYSYMFTPEWEMFEWNLGNTFNYAEMANLICPRPFMVERGHNDGVAPDEQVSYEFAKVRRRYDQLGIGDRTEIDYFNGPHTIHGVGTFAFLRKHLHWPQH